MRRATFGTLVSLLLAGCAGQIDGPIAFAGSDVGSAHARTSEANAGEAPRVASAHTDWIGGAAQSTYVLRSNAQPTLVGVWVDVPHHDATFRAPTALTLAIDTSGSMSGEKIAHARQAALRLVDRLADGDIVSVVTFSNTARTAIAPTVLDASARVHIRSLLSRLDATGGTALFAGVQLAQSQLLRGPATHLVRRVVVISDGQATVGPSSPDALGNLAHSQVPRGLGVTALGVGLDYDEATLNAMAVHSSGRLYHLEQSQELLSVIDEELALLTSTAAADAEVEIVPGPGVVIDGIDNAQFARHDGSLRVPLGAMFSGQQRELLVRTHLSDPSLGERALLSLRLRFRDPTHGGIERIKESLVAATVTDDPVLVANHVDSRTAAIVAMREAAVLAMSASHHVGDGNFAVATHDLEHAEHRLRQQATTTRAPKQREKLIEQAERLSAAKKDVSKVEAAPAASRAAAKRKSTLELNDAAMEADGF